MLPTLFTGSVFTFVAICTALRIRPFKVPCIIPVTLTLWKHLTFCFKLGMLCLSTSFWVLRAPESWSNYFFSAQQLKSVNTNNTLSVSLPHLTHQNHCHRIPLTVLAAFQMKMVYPRQHPFPVPSSREQGMGLAPFPRRHFRCWVDVVDVWKVGRMTDEVCFDCCCK